jgi:glutamine amidotransferase-like uncharacterized protein
VSARALVYRGPAACKGCSEAAGVLLESSTQGFKVEYVGPGERLKISDATLRSADLYVQPGGGKSLTRAYKQMKDSAAVIRNYTRSGGRYLGICMGGYLAGTWRGFSLLSGDTDQFITSPGASVTTTADTVVEVDWRGHRRYMFFQDGPIFQLRSYTSETIVLARYASNGEVAALVAPFGRGRIGVCGPHPEAPKEWYRAHNLMNPHGISPDLGHDLINALMQ